MNERQRRFPARWWLAFIALAVAALWPAPSPHASEHVEMSVRFGTERVPVLDATGPPDSVYRLRESTNLVDWRALATGHDGLFGYPDFSAANAPVRYYRTFVSDLTPEDDWKNQVHFPDDAFHSPTNPVGLEQTGWIKFAILLDEPHRVFFQDSSKYLFHYDFATNRLTLCEGLTPLEFDQISLYTGDQQLVAGTLLYPADPALNELGIQFVGADSYPVETIASWFELVKAMIVTPADTRAIYMPTYEQQAAAEAGLEFFTSNHIAVSSISRWVTDDECYSEGWAFGPLVYVPSDQIDTAYTNGTLSHTNILLTDAVPSEIPPVAGVISMSPATPNSHVVILSRSYAIPFVFIAASADQERLLSWNGDKVILIAEKRGDTPDIKTFNVEGLLTVDQEEYLLSLKAPPEIDITPKASFGSISVPTAGLGPADIRYVGGKAANFGILRQSIPSNCPSEAIAFTFDLWDAFMDQEISPSNTLRETIDQTLSPHTYPPDTASLLTDLKAVRTLIKSSNVTFSVQLQTAITNALAGFDKFRKIRFRSSTNVEDSDKFSGAGLYGSWSGCLMDDLDGDEEGPSHADPSQPEERGVYRAIKKVFASFYNDNAFLERLRHGVDEREAGMAVLAHYSFPDEIEMANGVATLALSRSDGNWGIHAELVTQDGAVSVANPDPGVLPEVVTVNVFDGGSPILDLEQRSSLVALGAYVFEWQAEYETLFGLLRQASEAYADIYPARTNLLLDLEYKKVEPGDLVIKQIREIPTAPGLTNDVPPFVFSDVNEFRPIQGEFDELTANHRLKSVWQFYAWNVSTNNGSVEDGIGMGTDVEYLISNRITSASGLLVNFPGAQVSVRDNHLVYAWTWGDGPDRRDYTLDFDYPYDIEDASSPILVLSDAAPKLTVNYATNQLRFSALRGTVSTTATDTVMLREINAPDAPEPAFSWFRDHTITNGGVEIRTSYHIGNYKMRGETPFILKTYVLQEWDETTITGLTSQPIVLRSPFSQTYEPSHHNFVEGFIFEPRLEPGIDPAILDELEQANIRAIIAKKHHAIPGPDGIRLWGLDDTLFDP